MLRVRQKMQAVKEMSKNLQPAEDLAKN